MPMAPPTKPPKKERPDEVLVVLERIEARLERIDRELKRRPPCKRKGWLGLIVGVFVKPEPEELIMLDLTNTQGVLLTVAPESAPGKPAPIDGTPTFTNKTPDTITIEPGFDGDPKACRVLTIDGATGPWEVEAEADADLGEGFESVKATIGGQVTHPKATSLNLQPGVPFEK